ncbi:MAG TPA: Flp pilus assembly protein CpaB [Gaiellaceae bacterium]|nr:Flp pilus assembly protein CpaB [Gaiellaceae bacterium]
MTYRMRNIFIAVALAGLAALLVTFYISNYKSSVQHQQTTVAVPVAAHDIPVGTLGSAVVSNGWLTTKQIPRDAVVPGAISSPDQIRTQVATQPTFAGEQITASRFGPLTQQGFAGQISQTQRAVQLSGDADQTLQGIVQPGDFVDFEGVITLDFGGSTQLTFSRTVVRNLKVLAVQTPGSPTAKIGATSSGQVNAVLLRMTDAQAQKISYVYALAHQSSNNYWTLELRPGLHSQDSPNSVETGFTILTDGISQTALKAALGVGVIQQAAGGH